MAGLIGIELQGNPPAWAIGVQSGFVAYFENEYGEQWIAKLDGSELVFAGQDMDWHEIHLTVDEARFALDSQFKGQVAERNAFMLGDTLINAPEAMWMAAVIASNLARMRV